MSRGFDGHPRYIAVEGVIGVGKTTLVRQLSQRLGARTIFEEFEDNPFLPDFYKDREAFAFSTQIFFLMSRFRQQEILAQGDLWKQYTLSDYFFDKDQIFALLTLKDHELNLYERLFEVLRVQVPRPDMVIYLSADHDMIMSRIAARGRDYEKDMDPNYIRQVAEFYAEFFFNQYADSPVLAIDTTHLDLRNDDAMIDRIVEAVNARRTRIPGYEPQSPEPDRESLPMFD